MSEPRLKKNAGRMDPIARIPSERNNQKEMSRCKQLFDQKYYTTYQKVPMSEPQLRKKE